MAETRGGLDAGLEPQKERAEWLKVAGTKARRAGGAMDQQEQAMRQREGRQGPKVLQGRSLRLCVLGLGRPEGWRAEDGMGLVLGTEDGDTVTQEEEQVDVVVVGLCAVGAGNERALAPGVEGGGGGGAEQWCRCSRRPDTRLAAGPVRLGEQGAGSEWPELALPLKGGTQCRTLLAGLQGTQDSGGSTKCICEWTVLGTAQL